MDKIKEIIEGIKRLEKELTEEVQRKEDEFFYSIRGKKVYFEEEIKRQHRKYATKFYLYFFHARFFNILTTPLIWACLPPALFLDLLVSMYHALCFPVYGIPKVKRSEYIVLDRQALKYLNLIEKINCSYCGYFTGLIAYVQEISARTEQYWCPIKHARRIASIHSRYGKFLEYGDAEAYQSHHEALRNDFGDVAEQVVPRDTEPVG